MRAAAIVLAILLGCHNSWAENESRLGVKIDFGGNIFTSDGELTTGYYPAIYDDPSIFDASNKMQYKFDSGIGKSVNAALCYKANRSVEFEFGFGYTSMPIEISQVSNYSFYGSGGYYIYDSYKYRAEQDADFRYMNFRTAINFILATNSNVDPYFSIGLNILAAKAKGTLTFAMPYVTEDATYYYLWIGPDAHLEPLEIEGSQTTFALDLGAGLEFEINPVLSVDICGAYLLQLQSAFEDFDEIIEDPYAQDSFRIIGYDFDGVNYSNFSFSLGMKLHFQ
jgi:hypothetical protein